MEDRRLMAELLAEVGRNPIIADLNRQADERVRLRLDEAIESLAPMAPSNRRSQVVDLIFLLSWGMMAMMELSPERNHAQVRRNVVAILRQEIGALAH